MAANFVESFNRVTSTTTTINTPSSTPYLPSREIVFAGDNVRLAGHMEYPVTPPPDAGYPVITMLHHAAGNTRNDYAHYASIALSCGYAVFRWDKRGTGRSGASGIGSTTQDAVNAYETALKQESINRDKAVILAQGEGTLLLSENFESFSAVQLPFGALLIANLVDSQQMLKIKTRVQVIIGTNDWISWQVYGKSACDLHNHTYPYGARFAVAHHADRLLIDTRKPGQRFHIGAKQIIKDWLLSLGEL